MDSTVSPHKICPIDCNTPEEFWDNLDPLHPFGNNKNSSKYIIYRGQSDSEWPLLPKIFRKEYFNFLVCRRNKTKSNITNTYCQLEQEFLFQLILSCERSGVPLYIDSRKIREKYFKRDPRNGYPSKPGEWPNNELFELIALAQHHGLPTRLLDWTRRSYVAAFFAANSALIQETKKDQRFAVWGLDYKIFSAEDKIEFLEVPGFTSKNISSQSGCFTICKNDIGKVGGGGNFEINYHKMVPEEFPLSLESTIKPENQKFLWQVTLPVKYAVEILSYCSFHSITNATMFPGYDGCAKHAVDATFNFKNFGSVKLT